MTELFTSGTRMQNQGVSDLFAYLNDTAASLQTRPRWVGMQQQSLTDGCERFRGKSREEQLLDALETSHCSANIGERPDRVTLHKENGEGVGTFYPCRWWKKNGSNR